MFPTGGSNTSGAFGGVVRPGYTPPPARPNVFSAYSGSIPQTASDYDTIMGQYKDLYGSAAGQAAKPPITAGTATAVKPDYQTSQDVKQSTAGLAEHAQTGGYSGADIANIRARSVSPIRSIYANAQRNLDRSRALQGGYSPGFATAQARMAREMADTIASKTTDTEAGIAQMVAQGKLAGGQAYAGAASGEAGRQEDVSKFGAAAENQASQFNVESKLKADELNRQYLQDAWAKQLEAVRGQQSLYGTTPALASTFGAQALNAADLEEKQRQYDTSFQSGQAQNIANAVLNQPGIGNRY